MDEYVKIILKKLDVIDSRLKAIEQPHSTYEVDTSQKIERDPLFSKALETINKYDEISSKMLAEALSIDVKRAEAIMDQMEAAGIGVCYTKEV